MCFNQFLTFSEPLLITRYHPLLLLLEIMHQNLKLFSQIVVFLLECTHLSLHLRLEAFLLGTVLTTT